MFKRLDPRDINITPFKAYKEFTVTNVDSGSGVFGFSVESGSAHIFSSGSADSASFFEGTPSPDNKPFATYYALPSWFTINQLYYARKRKFRISENFDEYLF